MSRPAYEVTSFDELERLPVDTEGLTWRPIRRRLGISSFGANAYTAEQAGERVVEEHRESGGHEELYVVVAGRATFTLDGEDVDAPAGTAVHLRPGTVRGALAAEPGTTVLALGAKPGVAFEPSQWEDSFAGTAYARLGRADDALKLMRPLVEREPDSWEAHYNLACVESLLGRHDDALASLRRAAELSREEVARYAADDSDLDPIRADPRFSSAVAGQA